MTSDLKPVVVSRTRSRNCIHAVERELRFDIAGIDDTRTQLPRLTRRAALEDLPHMSL